jgi:hypothetical protein
MDPFDLVLAAVVKDAIDKSGRTQKSVWKKAGFAESTWDRRIAGTSSFTISELTRIAQAVGCKPSTLVNRAERTVKAAA